MKKLVTAVAAVMLLGIAPGARADNRMAQGGGGSSSEQGGMGGAGSTGSEGGSAGSTGGMGSTGSSGTAGGMGSTGMGMGQQSVEGRVLKADRSTITIEHNGAALPLSVASSTSFQGVKSAKDIKEGQQVRASFDLKKDKNELRSVEVLSGAGGAGGAGGMGGAGGNGTGGGNSSGGSKSPGGGY